MDDSDRIMQMDESSKNVLENSAGDSRVDVAAALLEHIVQIFAE